MLEKYKFVRRIGDGTFGEIFQVCLRSTGEMFAMKKIPEVEGREQLFETEIRVMMKTFHPNIVKIYEYFYDEDHEGKHLRRALYIVMEYCRDGDLFSFVSRRKQQGDRTLQQDIISIIRQIVYGCMALNQKGILHRDLKPENILLDGPTVKIADFGCAKLFELMKTYSYTSLSFNVGTPMYSAPEILNLEPYDDRCDVWSLGVIVYFMVYATVPFLERDIKKLRAIMAEKRIAEGEIQLPESPTIGEPLRAIIRGMLKYHQEERLTWTEIIGMRLFQPTIDYPSRFASYLIEVVKILGWIVQSLLLNFSRFYPAESLSRLCLCVNFFIIGREEILCKMLTKDPSVEEMFPPGLLDLHQFEVDLLLRAKKCNQRLEKYLKETTARCEQLLPPNERFNKSRSDRHYLWRAQKKARTLMLQASTQHGDDEDCLRSLYCLALVAGYDRLLGEHEYLKLDSNSICNYLKHCPVEELGERVSYQLSRLS